MPFFWLIAVSLGHLLVFMDHIPETPRGQAQVWEELHNIEDGWSGPWCIAGDFNEIPHSRERTTWVNASNM